MKQCTEPAISEITGTILIIALLVVLAAVVSALFFGTPLLPKKPVLATFSASKVMGVNVAAPHNTDVPVIMLYQTAGDQLTQEYASGTHSGINGTKIKLISPAGTLHTVVQSVTMTGKTIEKGEPFYIFHRVVGEPNEYWITTDPARIFSASWGGVQPFSPRGKWKIVITEEKETNMVLFEKEMEL